MPRVKDSIKKEIEKAEKAARKAVFHPKKQKRQKRESVPSEGTVAKEKTTSQWVKDEWGRQGEVFFDGHHYWGVGLRPKDRDGIQQVYPVSWTPEEWEKRKKGEVKKDDASESGRGSVERASVGGSLGNHKRTTDKPSKRQKSTNRKTRTRKSVSGGKRSKVVKGKRNGGKDVPKGKAVTVSAKKKTTKKNTKKPVVTTKKVTKKTRKTEHTKKPK